MRLTMGIMLTRRPLAPCVRMPARTRDSLMSAFGSQNAMAAQSFRSESQPSSRKGWVNGVMETRPQGSKAGSIPAARRLCPKAEPSGRRNWHAPVSACLIASRAHAQMFPISSEWSHFA
jgi:hypothetical protein